MTSPRASERNKEEAEEMKPKEGGEEGVPPARSRNESRGGEGGEVIAGRGKEKKLLSHFITVWLISVSICCGSNEHTAVV